ncbi:MAG: DNRLRE domain-containing protein [Planctomycetota bacterium]|nr:DNRLRE domain-containing protein [Planctomycetota bacterium]
MFQPTRIGLALLATALTASLSLGQTANILAQQDSSIYEDPTGMTASGVGQFGFTGTNNQGDERRYMIQFDVAGAIPAGSTITNARLELHVAQFPPSGVSANYGAHLMNVSWGEGPANGFGQGAPAQAGDATWIHRVFPGTNWTNAGGDFSAAASGSSAMNSVGMHSISSAGLISDVQGFLDTPVANFGWMILCDSGSNRTARGFAAREFSLVAQRPVLVVDYTIPTPVTVMCDPANVNSSGVPASLSGNFGSGVGSDLHLNVSGGPLPLADGSRMLGYLLVGNLNASPGIPVGDGQFCLVGIPGASFGRYNVFGTNRNSIGLFDAVGELENLVGTGGVSGYGFDVPSEVEIAGLPMTTIMSGDTYQFQCWYRDTLAGPGHSNFSSGISVVFP